jgi:hypothetical protein
MTLPKVQTLATTLGLLSAAGLLFVWVFILAPVRWDLRYPGGGLWGLLTISGSIVTSFAAAEWGSRKWYALTVIAVLTITYMAMFIRSAYWN